MKANNRQNTEESTRNAISEIYNKHNQINVSISIDKISASLGYLAQCDYISGNNGDELDSDGQFGRGYLLDMLGDGLAQFTKSFEEFESIYHQQLEQNAAEKTQNDQLKAQLEKLATIKDKYQQLQALNGNDGEQAKTLQQQIEELSKQLP